MTVILSRSWPYFFWALTVLSVGGIGLACLNLSKPQWTPLSASLRLGLDCYMWILAYWLCRTSLLQSLNGADLSPTEAAQKVTIYHQMLANSAIWVAVAGVITLAFDLRRAVRVGREG